MSLTDCNGLVDVFECENRHLETEECSPESKEAALKDRNERYAQLLHQLDENKDLILGYGPYYVDIFYKVDGAVLANEMRALHDMLCPFNIRIEIAGRRTIRIYSP
jgi:hypothetical protein